MRTIIAASFLSGRCLPSASRISIVSGWSWRPEFLEEIVVGQRVRLGEQLRQRVGCVEDGGEQVDDRPDVEERTEFFRRREPAFEQEDRRVAGTW